MGLECKQQQNKNIVEIKIFFIIFGFLLVKTYISSLFQKKNMTRF